MVADATIYDEEGLTAIPFETGRIPMQTVLLQLCGVYRRKDVEAFVGCLGVG